VDLESGLIGRDAELAAIARARTDGEVHGVVLVGPGGVGKTRLATEGVRLGAAAGDPSYRVSATRSAAEVPLGAFGTLLPSFGGTIFDLLGAARRALHERAGDGTLLLFVDDAHLLDDVSATLLLHLAEDDRVFLIVTVRQSESVPDAVTTLWKDGHADRVGVAELPDAAMSAIAEDMAGGEIDELAMGRLLVLAAGNPLALRELVLGAIESGGLRREHGRWTATADLARSARLAELVTGRLQALDDDERHAFELVVLGEPLSPHLLSDLVPLRAVASLEAKHLVEVRNDARRSEVWLSTRCTARRSARRFPACAACARRRARDQPHGHWARRRGDLLRLALWNLERGDLSDPDSLVEAARQSYVALDFVRAEQLADAVWRTARTVAAGHLLGWVRCTLNDHEGARRSSPGPRRWWPMTPSGCSSPWPGRRTCSARTTPTGRWQWSRPRRRRAPTPTGRRSCVATARRWRCCEGSQDWPGRSCPHAHGARARRERPAVRGGVDRRRHRAAFDGQPLTAMTIAQTGFAHHIGIWEEGSSSPTRACTSTTRPWR